MIKVQFCTVCLLLRVFNYKKHTSLLSNFHGKLLSLTSLSLNCFYRLVEWLTLVMFLFFCVCLLWWSWAIPSYCQGKARVKMYCKDLLILTPLPDKMCRISLIKTSVNKCNTLFSNLPKYLWSIKYISWSLWYQRLLVFTLSMS